MSPDAVVILIIVALVIIVAIAFGPKVIGDVVEALFDAIL